MSNSEDTAGRMAFLAKHGIEPHAYRPGQIRNRLTVCADCLKAEAFVAHDSDLPRRRPRR